jgi:SAM-dependent methyltransferase
MADSISGKLQIWEGWAPPLVKPTVAFPAGGERTSATPTPSHALSEHLYTEETFAQRRRPHQAMEPYSLQWFLEVEADRYARHGRWIPRLLEFTKHTGDRLLGLGGGLGTDWAQYARHGAEVIACSTSLDQRLLVQRNFELRGLHGNFQHGSPAALAVESASIDVVCLNTLLQPDSDPQAVVEEVYRVLKPGGKVLAISRAYYDVDFWCDCCLPWRHWFRPRSVLAGSLPAFMARQLRRLFGRFVEHRCYKRHLRRSTVPHLWRWLPLPLLERLMGQVLVLKAFKPLSAAITPPLAA